MAHPQLTLQASAARRVRHWDAWVFRDELHAAPAELAAGETVELLDTDGTFLGYGFYSPVSHVAVRVVSWDKAEPPSPALFKRRLQQALARRGGLAGTNAKRLVYSEADGLPGLIVDQYADYLVFQSRTAAIDRLKAPLVKLLQDALKPQGIFERSDKDFREAEGLSPAASVLAGDVPERVEISEDDLRFLVDLRRGNKTGFYLDQRDTRRLVRGLIRPGQRVADVCAYTGAFGVAAARAGAQVVCVEQLESAVALARENAALNGVAERMEFVTGDAFYWLEAKAKSQERFDWVLLDPPALAKSKAEVSKARHALHRLVSQALQLLAPEGTLVLSICTYHLLGLTEEILRIAAADCGKRLTVRAVSQQATDHPWVLQMPMTRYLATWAAQASPL